MAEPVAARGPKERSLRIPGSLRFSQIVEVIFAALLFAQTACAAAFPGQSRAAIPSIDERSDQPGSTAAEGRIRLDVAVTDKAGKPVTDLRRGDFTLLDGQPSAIVSFSAFDADRLQPDAAVQIILVIDTIHHKAHEVLDVQPDVIKFLRENGGHLAQPVSVYRVTEAGVSVTPQPSVDGNELANELTHQARLREVPREKTGFSVQNSSFENQHLEVLTALQALGSIVLMERRKPGRKLLVWVGYGGIVGEDSFDWITEFSTRIREARITLSSVTLWQDGTHLPELPLGGVKSASQANPGNLALEVLAVQSGGRVLEDSSDIAAMIDKCVKDANDFYTVTFNPPPTDQPDEYHSLKMEVSRPGLLAHTNTGYYNQPAFYDQPIVPSARITVAQLEQLLANTHGTADADTARQLSTLELTEAPEHLAARLVEASLARSEVLGRACGNRGCLRLPQLSSCRDHLHKPSPDRAAQQQMQSKMIDYLEETIPRLPTCSRCEPPLIMRSRHGRRGSRGRRRRAIECCS